MIHDISSDRALLGRFSLLGGFLGAGKTTLIGQQAKWLRERGLKVALVTNDQGEGLLDTASAREAMGQGSGGAGAAYSSGVAEITGGCFCCRLDELVGAIAKLGEEGRPDVIIAEPVGSCTDLMATVVRPLEQIYKTPLTLSPLSVVLDARRALAALGGKKSKRDFHRDVGYIYRKQIEEAEWLVVNKSDLLNEEDLKDLLARIEKEYQAKRVFLVSAKRGEGVEEWFQETLEHETQGGRVVEVDYERYAIGEAMLGWVNSEATCEMRGETDWGDWILGLGKRIAVLLDENGYEVGHFKMSVVADEVRYRVHQVIGGEGLEVVVSEAGPGRLAPDSDDMHRGEPPLPRFLPCLLVNLRAEGDATKLEALVALAINEQEDVKVTFQNKAAFQPGKPVPVHRIAEVSAAH